VTPFFGTYPYTYTWSYDDGSADSTLTDVPAGDYWVKVTDANSKTDSVAFTISQPEPIHVAADITDVTCTNDYDGAINITVSGGTSPYSYLWSTSDGSGLDQSLEDQTALTAGHYTVLITDDHSCTKDTTIIVAEPDPISFGGSSVTAIVRPPGSNGAIDLVVHGGTPDYTYYWEGPSGFSSTEEDLSSLDVGGDYKVVVTDNNNCTNDTTFLVEDKDALVATIDSVKDVSCYGGSDGYAHVTVTGGSGSYSYAWTNSGGNTVGGNSPSLPDMEAGTYYVTVTDQADARTASTSAKISDPDEALNIALSAVEDVSCNGENDGKIDITVSGGWLPYTFDWTGPSGFTANTEDIADLAPGYYNVTVNDAGGCLVQQLNIQITEPDPLIVTIKTVNTILCNGELTGELEADPVGGTLPYSYLWDDPGHQTTQNASYLEAGTYTVAVTDANGCSAEATESLTQPDPITVTAIVNDVTCSGDEDGSIILTVDGGTVPYNYLWTPGNETSKDLADIDAGEYSVTITDANNCTWDSTFLVAAPEPAFIDSVVSADVTGCFDANNGSIIIYASGGSGSFEYSIDGGSTFQTDSNFTGLAGGSYDIAVKDNECILTGNPVTLDAPAEIVISGVDATPSCPGDNKGKITITASGGTGTLSYQLLNDNGTPLSNNTTGVFDTLSIGNYTVQVTDDNNCGPVTSSVEVIMADNCSLVIYNAFSPNGDGKNEVWHIRGIETYPNCVVKVFNTWGKQVFSSKGYTEPWDGTYNGKTLPAGTYYYIIELGPGEKTYSGTVNIVK
jgi:gliding motility-associated-like protein